ncbi:MAG: hypothetical protein A4E55_02005 [Pelotomaculum sp. PtaU1.Bin035]|nr:MAG: hypothetical protein A4E55_02005 [Pelotomaculum sp. PtaU1.Bin035]
MKRVWELEDLIDYFTIVPTEMKLIENKAGANRLGCAVFLKFFQIEGKFPNNRSEIPKPVIDYLAKQLFLSPEAIENYDWNGRAIKYHRAEIREFFGFRECRPRFRNSRCKNLFPLTV